VRFKRASFLVLILPTVVLGSLWATYRWSERYFLSEIADRSRDSLNLYAENIRGWLGRFGAVPRIYARPPGATAFLRPLCASHSTHRRPGFGNDSKHPAK